MPRGVALLPRTPSYLGGTRKMVAYFQLGESNQCLPSCQRLFKWVIRHQSKATARVRLGDRVTHRESGKGRVVLSTCPAVRQAYQAHKCRFMDSVITLSICLIIWWIICAVASLLAWVTRRLSSTRGSLSLECAVSCLLNISRPLSCGHMESPYINQAAAQLNWPCHERCRGTWLMMSLPPSDDRLDDRLPRPMATTFSWQPATGNWQLTGRQAALHSASATLKMRQN